jgi:hypothetical protein
MELINFLAELRAGAVATVAVRIRACAMFVCCRPSAGYPRERFADWYSVVRTLDVPLIWGFSYITSLPIGLG